MTLRNTLLELLIYGFFLFNTGSCSCQADAQTTASSFIRGDGSALDTDTWTDGQVYTLTCKQDVTSMAWSNNIRTVSGITLSTIDQYSSTSRGQQGEVLVTCDGSDFSPDVFGYEVSTWCAAGCNKVPEDYEKYWDVSYPSRSITKTLSEAPIAIDIDNEISVTCRKGYAQATADEGKTSVYCTNAGWSPSMLYWPKCVAGCDDVTQDVANGYTLAAPSTTAGDPPFITGDVVEFSCDDGYVLEGAQAVTCTSGQFWDNDTPTCSSVTGAGVSSEVHVVISRSLLLALLVVVLYTFWTDSQFTALVLP